MNRLILFLRHLSKVLMLLLLASTLHPAVAQTEVAAGDVARPKIGLALSGGGARGAAHIGVLRVLEENNVPIDYIAGTSMGAIVGGLYAAGMDTDTIEAELAAIDWDDIFHDLPPRTEKSFRRKRDDDLNLVRAKPGFSDGKLKLPRGLIRGQKVDVTFSRLALPVAAIEDFDDLMIPFRAVAADIATGEEVVIDSGNLGMAIRASMSIPAVFTPAEIDGRLLVDGGIVNNLPISVVRGMGADIVIAIDISTPLASKEEIDSVLLITSQLTGLMTRGNVEEQIATLTEKDVFIVPDLGDVSTTDFKEFAQAIPPGRAAAMDKIEELRTLSLPDADYQAYLASLIHPGTQLPIIDRIKLENNTRLSDEYIQSRIFATHTGKPLDLPTLEKDLGQVYGLELFENVRYDVSAVGDETVLDIQVNERSWGPSYLQFGFEYNSNGEGENVFNSAVTYLKTGINPSGGEWRSGLQFGTEWALLTEFHQPFGPKLRYFVNPLIAYRQRIFNSVEGSEVTASVRVSDVRAEISAGREFATWGEARVGIRYADGEAERVIGDPSLTDFSFKQGESFIRFSVDEFDDFNIPQNGTILKAELLQSREGLGADVEFDQLLTQGAVAFTRNRNTLLASGTYNATISGTAPLQNQFSLGGFGRLSGFTSRELTGQHAVVAVLAYYRRLNDSPRMPIYAGITFESGNVWESRSDISLDDTIQAGSLFLAVKTPLGPVYLAYGRAEDNIDALHFFLGRPFSL